VPESSPSPATPAANAPPPLVPTPDTNLLLAEKFFVEGRIAAAKGDHAAACARFEASRRLDPRAVGTVLNIAICSEALARYATAARLYHEVIDRDRAQGTRQDRIKYAESRLTFVEPKISTLRVLVPDDVPDPGFEIIVDGVVLEHDSWNRALPIDGGAHVVESTAPKKRRQRRTVQVGLDHAEKEVTLTPLENEPKPTKNLGLIVGSAGLGALAIAGGLGIWQWADCGGLLVDTCKKLNHASDADASSTKENLQVRARIVDVAAGVGVIGLGIGTYLYLSSPKPGTSVTVIPDASASGGGLRVNARF
jgi:hypothetical protein